MLVLKVGGSLRNLDALLDDVASRDEPMVIVHGANRELSELSTALGHPPRMVTSARGDVSRYSDALTMDHFLMAYRGKVNGRIIEGLRRRGVNAVGMSAMDGGIAVGRRRASLRAVEDGRTVVLHGDHAGSIERIDVALLRLLLGAGYVPVLSPPAISEDGTVINVDGDRLAAKIAAELQADSLVLFADTPGLLRDPADEGSVIPTVACDEVEQHMVSARGRMRTKLRAAVQARQSGVAAVALADGRRPRPLTDALTAAGTVVV